MRFDTILKSGTVVTAAGSQSAVFAALLVTLFVTVGSASLPVQNSSDSEPPEMLVTEQGFLVMNTPKGWVRSEGPGLAYFIRKGDKAGKAPVWIYVSSAPIGPDEEAKDAKAYIQSDIAGFRERFKDGLVQEEEPLDLPKVKARATAYTFRSGEKRNAIEQVVYITELNRVLTLVLSAREEGAFTKSLPVFREFVKSYGGSIIPTPNPK